MKIIKVTSIVILSSLFFYLWFNGSNGEKIRENNGSDKYVFLNLYGGGWFPIEVKINGKSVDAPLNGVKEISTFCKKGNNNLSIEGRWEETTYINKVDLGIALLKGSGLFDENKKTLLKKSVERNENNPKDLSVSYDFIL